MIALVDRDSTIRTRPARCCADPSPVTRHGSRVTGVEHDNLDRLSKEISAQGVVEYTYDALGRRTTMTANGATPVSYGYDAASRLTQVAQAGLVVGLGYDNANRRTSLTYPNGTNTSYSYDNASRITAITHNGPSGLIESLSYAYDAAGNRISLTRTNGTASNLPQAAQAAYDAANQQIQFNAASPNQTFDANGNLTSDGTNTYTWDARNRMVAQSGPGVNATFQYDALGRRVSKTVNGMTTGYLYDGNDIVQEIGGSAVGASYVRSLSIDEPFVRQTSTGNEFYHVDALGSSLALSNAAGAAAVSYSYEAFGKTTISGTSSNPFRYTGREDDGTEFYYYRARYYSPTAHRFLGEDPARLMGGDGNFYMYVANNPLYWRDPSGLFKYNKPPPATEPLPPAVEAMVVCLENCIPADLIVTGGSEAQKHRAGSKHPAGQAVDFGFNSNSSINKDNGKRFFCCAKKCGFQNGFPEGPGTTFPNSDPHFHIETTPGGPGYGPGYGGQHGSLPSDTCACK
jgi:RHS repeat-associated protein